MSKAAEIAKTMTEKLGAVANVSNWNDKRVYLTPACMTRSFKGESTHQIYIDVATGKLVNQAGKGTCRTEFNAAVRQIVAAVNA